MTSEKYREAYVWVWLPEETKPVVAGRLETDNGITVFNYGRSYLERVADKPQAIPIYLPELPLQPGVLPLVQGLTIPGCIRDAAPDAWGRRVIINKLTGAVTNIDPGNFDELTFLLESGSDRIGALDFQHSPTDYEARTSHNVTMDELIESADRIEKGIPLNTEICLLYTSPSPRDRG